MQYMSHTHTLKENEKDTKFFVVQRPCPCKIKTKKEVKLQVLLLKVQCFTPVLMSQRTY